MGLPGSESCTGTTSSSSPGSTGSWPARWPGCPAGGWCIPTATGSSSSAPDDYRAVGRPASESGGSLLTWNSSRIHGTLDVGDPQSRVRLVTAVHRHEVGGERFHLPAIAQPARVDAAGAGDPGGERLHQVGRGSVVPEHHHVQVDPGDIRVKQRSEEHTS